MMATDDFGDRKLQTFGIDPLGIVKNDSFCATRLQMYLNLNPDLLVIEASFLVSRLSVTK